MTLAVGSFLWASPLQATSTDGTDGESMGSSDSENLSLPCLELSEKVYTFPKAVETEDVSHDFMMKNTGKGVLEIKSLFSD